MKRIMILLSVMALFIDADNSNTIPDSYNHVDQVH